MRIFPAVILAAVCLPTAHPADTAGDKLLDVRPVVRQWTTLDGLPQNTVRGIRQTPDGFLWVATLGGLARFDGIDFRNHLIATHPELGSNRFTALHADIAGNLWIGTEDAGLIRRSNGAFQRLDLCQPGCLVRRIIDAGADALWVATNQSVTRVDRRSGRSLEQVNLPPGHHGAVSLLWQPGRGLYMVSNGALLFRPDDGGEVQVVIEPSQLQITKLIPADGDPWVSANEGVYQLTADHRLYPVPELSGKGSLIPRAVARTPAGTWLALRPSGLALLEDSGRVRVIEQLHETTIETLRGHADGTLWIGTQTRGLMQLRPGYLRVPGHAGSPMDQQMVPVTGDGRGGIWAGVTCGDLVNWNAGRVRQVAVRPSLPGDCIWSLLREGDTIWVGSYGGGVIAHTPDGVHVPVLRGERNLQLPVRTLYRDNGGLLWIGTDHGVYRLTGGFIERVPGSPEELILHTRQMADGSIWFGTGNGILTWHNGTFAWKRTDSPLDSLPVRALHETGGAIWAGTYGGGLWRIADGAVTRFGRHNGLFDDVVSCILEAGGHFWMSGNRGIHRTSIADLEAVAAGRAQRVAAFSLTRADGMLNEETNGGGQPACHAAPDGTLWFPTLAGPVGVIPDRLPSRTRPPPVHIDGIRADSQTLTESNSDLVFGSDARNLEIDYTAPYFIAPERLRFRYRLEGHDETWTIAGDRRTAYFPVLPEGRTRFVVQAGSDNGRWFPTTAGVDIAVRPGLMSMPGAWAAVVALFLAAAFLGQRVIIVRVRRQARKLDETVRRRTRELRAANQKLARLASQDELTGIANYRGLWQVLRRAWRELIESGGSLGVVVCDVDRFKQFNDSLGHQAGDACLRRLARQLHSLVTARGGHIGRYGGEEFVVVLPGFDLEATRELAEVMRRLVENLGIAHPAMGGGPLTVSFGVSATRPDARATPEALVASADQALYRAKQGGRNRVEATVFELPEHGYDTEPLGD